MVQNQPPANSSGDPISKKIHHKKGWWSGPRCRPWVQAPVPQKQTTTKNNKSNVVGMWVALFDKNKGGTKKSACDLSSEKLSDTHPLIFTIIVIYLTIVLEVCEILAHARFFFFAHSFYAKYVFHILKPSFSLRTPFSHYYYFSSGCTGVCIRASSLQGRYSTTWAISPALFCVGVF
jgi:hypothetical protein